MSELKNCPWCGGEVCRDYIDDDITRTIGCSNCGISMHMTDDEWNTRAESAQEVELELWAGIALAFGVPKDHFKTMGDVVDEVAKLKRVLEQKSIKLSKLLPLKDELICARAAIGEVSEALLERDAELQRLREALKQAERLFIFDTPCGCGIKNEDACLENICHSKSELRKGLKALKASLGKEGA